MSRKLSVACVAAAPLLGSCSSMNCGAGVPLCGTLTLQTGLGSGVYHSKTPLVHGLWPENGHYGTSKCIAPQDTTGPNKVYECYNTPGSTHQHALWFENHEWTKHGVCAGAKNVDDFFAQVCALSKAPLEVLADAKVAKASFEDMGSLMKRKGYPVWKLDQANDQVELSVCAGADGRWKLSALKDMPQKCGGGAAPHPHPYDPPSPSPKPTPVPAPAAGQCIPGRRGPKCSLDADCKGLSGCLRCAHSGFCTDQQLPWEAHSSEAKSIVAV